MTVTEREAVGGRSIPTLDLPPSQMSLTLSKTDDYKEPQWEQLVSCVTSPEKRRLVDLARRQGLLFAFSFPKPGIEARVEPMENPDDQFLTNLLKGENVALRDFQPQKPDTFYDATLNLIQRDAVAKALSTPDICVIQGNGKSSCSRVAAEIISQAVQVGQRVLLMGQSAVGLDKTLERLGGREPLFALRHTGKKESAKQLSPAVLALTYAERSRVLRERTIESANKAHSETQARLQCHPHEADLWVQFEQIAQDRVQTENLLSREMINQLTAQQQANRESLARVAGELAPLIPIFDAKKRGRWWMPSWWLATQAKMARCIELESQQQSLKETLKGQDEELAQWTARLSSAGEGHSKANGAGPNHSNGKHDPIDANDLEQRLNQIDDHVCKLLDELHLEAIPCGGVTPLWVQQSRQKWMQQCKEETEKARFLAQWLEHVEEFGEILSKRLPHLANVVAATVGTVNRDSEVSETIVSQSFDLLVLVEAHRVNESELLEVAANAKRWVILGESVEQSEAQPDMNAKKSAKRKKRQPRRSHKVSANWFGRLIQQLHCEPISNQFSWCIEHDRLCCRFQPVAPEDREYLESENVEDQPDVELRILNLPGSDPVMAEVAFSNSLDIAQAKEFIYRELEEVALQTSARNLCWEIDDSHISLKFANRAGKSDCVTLAPGVCERFVSDWDQGDESSILTIAFDFDRGKGWDLAGARQWLLQNLGWNDLGRTILLP